MADNLGKTDRYAVKFLKGDGDLKDRSIQSRHLAGSGSYDVLNAASGVFSEVWIEGPDANIDMNQNEIQQLVIENRTTDPGSPVAGQIWFRTDI